MARLPVDGEANWGQVLNEYLLVAHKEDGTQRPIFAGINVKDFGAKGDGQANDAPPIQAAIEAALSSKIRTVYIPAGEYRLAPYGENNHLEPRILIRGSNLQLIGDGYASYLRTEGKKNDDHAYNAITVSPEGILPTNSLIRNIEICNLRLSSDASASYLKDVYSVGLITALYPPQEVPPGQDPIGAVVNLSIHDCTIETESLVGFTNNINTKRLRFYNNQIVKTGSHGIYMAGFSTDVWIQNNIFDGASRSADHTATGIALKNVENLYLTHNRISGYNNSAVNPADAPNTRLFIIGNLIQMGYPGGAGINMNWGTKVLIANNIFEDIDDTGVVCQAVTSSRPPDFKEIVHHIEDLRITDNEFRNVSKGRAITVEKIGGGYLSNVSIVNNWGEECNQGIKTDGVAGILKVSSNQMRKTKNEQNPGLGISVINVSSSDSLVDHNIIRGYGGTDISPAAFKVNNLVDGVLQ